MVKRISFVMSMIAACLFTANAATVSGTVTNVAGGAAIAGATVTLTPVPTGTALTATTNARGEYTITVTAATYPANYTISATAPGFQASAGNYVRVQSANSTITRDFELTASAAGVGVVISGTVTIAGGTTPISGAKVLLLQGYMNPVVVDSAVTAANGTYRIDSVEAGTYRMSASASGYVTASVNNITVASTPVTRNFSLAAQPSPTTILGVVSNANTSAAVVGAKIVLLSGTTRVDSTTTATGGIYSFANVAAGTYSTVTSATGYVNRTTSNIVVAGSPVTSNVALTPVTADTVRGTVTIQGTTTPIAGAKVVLSAGDANIDSATTNASGVYVMPAVASGTYRITVSAAGYYTYTSDNRSPVNVIGETVVRNVSLTALPSPTTILGVVTNATTTAAIVGAKVVLRTGTTAVDSTVTVAGGIYSFANVAAGTYSTVTSATGFANRTTNNIVVAGSPVTSNVTLIPITYDTVSGQVRIQGTTTGIVGATLVLVNNSGTPVDTVTSIANGAYMFVNVATGSYTIVTSAVGYNTATTNLNMPGGAVTLNISLTVRALGASALGVVTNDATDAALVGAKVVLQQRTGGGGTWISIDSTVTVANGLYVIDSIQIGSNYRLVASMAGFTSSTQNITVTTNGSTVTANFALLPAVGTVNGPSIAAKLPMSVGLKYGSLVLSGINGAAEVNVLSANGKVVFRTAITANTNSVALPSGLSAGSYLVNIVQKSGVISKMVMMP